MTVTEQLRKAILASGLSQAEIARLAEVPQPRVSVFLSGGGLKSDTFDALAKVMGMELRQVKKRKKSGQ